MPICCRTLIPVSLKKCQFVSDFATCKTICFRTLMISLLFSHFNSKSSKPWFCFVSIRGSLFPPYLIAKSSDVQTQLNLALAWNRCDVARTRILDPENRAGWQDQISGSLGEELLFDALLQDKIDFVQLLIDNGVELKRFLTAERLEMLYRNVRLWYWFMF